MGYIFEGLDQLGASGHGIPHMPSVAESLASVVCVRG